MTTGNQFLDAPVVTGSRLPAGASEVLENDLLPWHHFINGLAPLDYTGGGTYNGNLANSSWWFSALHYGSGIGFEMRWDVSVAAGTWTICWFTDRRNDYGIVRPTLDSVEFGTAVDHYNAAFSLATQVETGVVLTKGMHSFGMKITGRNASAPATPLSVVSGLALTRTA